MILSHRGKLQRLHTTRTHTSESSGGGGGGVDVPLYTAEGKSDVPYDHLFYCSSFVVFSFQH